MDEGVGREEKSSKRMGREYGGGGERERRNKSVNKGEGRDEKNQGS